MGIPSTGVPAACAFATAHIQVYSASPIEHFQIQHPDLDLSIYIGDFVGSVEGQSEDLVAKQIIHAADSLHA
eukprot:4527204-Heterocapsa_arctica.AAC.1